MGISQSKNINNEIKSDYQKMIQFYGFHNLLTKNNFLKILKNYDLIFVERLWIYYVGTNENLSEINYNKMIDECRFRTCERWLKYVANILCFGDTANKDEIKTLIDCASSCKGLYQLINYSFRPINDNGDVCISECISWIDRNLPELGTDVARYIYKILTAQNIAFENMNIESTDLINKLNSPLITVREMTTLCASLPMSYKSSGKSDEFLFMNVKEWTLLYNSDVNGLSSSKFKETSFDYAGNLLLFIKCNSGVFCLATDVGLKEDWNAYGGIDTKFIQLEPVFKTIVSGSRSVSGNKNGIIFSHFSAKSGRKGLFIGHNPMKGAAVEIDEDLSKISILGNLEAIRLIEVWAVGSNVKEKLSKLKDVRNWEKNEVNKHKNRKIKADDWIDNPDREILGMGGVNVKHSDLIGGIDREQENHD